MYTSLATSTHYEILGVPPGVGPLVLDAMYQARLATFHPGGFGRKQLGTYLRRLEIIVQCVGEAHATLRDPVQRKAYDRRLVKQAG
jgi:curved DNA-binding protein CbpA